MPSGSQIAKLNVQKFENYWKGLRAKGSYLPLKRDGTIWFDQVSQEADIGKSAFRQNPVLAEQFGRAVEETMAAELAKSKRTLQSEGQGAYVNSTDNSVSRDSFEKLKRLERKNNELEQKLAVLSVAHENAVAKVKSLEEQNAHLKELIERFEYSAETGANPGPY